MAKAEVTKWSVLSELNEDFVSNIKLFFVFGANGRQVIIVTNDDNVYAFGTNNSYGCLGLGHKDAVKEPTKIEELCQKFVVDIQFGGYYDYNGKQILLALTRNNEVFSWGTTDYGLLGVGNQTKQSLSPVLIKELLGKSVIDIKCSGRQCLALTLPGELYYWGFVKQGVIEFKPILMININAENIISISCGTDHSLVLTKDGKVYSWGDDKLQSNNGRYTHTEYPQLVNVSNITKIRCGSSHSLILSADGDIYTFGDNSFITCGERNINDSLIKLSISNKFIDIGAMCGLSVCLSKDGFCYLWGQCGNQSIGTPTKTRFTRIIDVLEYYSKIQVTFDRIYYESNDFTNCNQSVISTNKFTEKFNKQEDSDIAFKIGNQYIYAHKLILKSVSKHFDVMLSSNYWRECNEKVLEVYQYSYAVYYAFIEYIYTNVVNIKPEDAIELLELSNAYFENELKKKCVAIIKGFVSIENMFQIYSHGVYYRSEDLKEYCVNFFCSNARDKSVAANILANYTKI